MIFSHYMIVLFQVLTVFSDIYEHVNNLVGIFDEIKKMKSVLQACPELYQTCKMESFATTVNY